LIEYRQANESDIPALAAIRAVEWGTKEYWIQRIGGYMRCELHPQQALKTRIVYIASENDSIVGFIAGHLTKRYECDGELQWINVIAQFTRAGVASQLLCLLAEWFVELRAFRICVDVDPDNLTARSFYFKHGAAELNKHWLVWNNIQVILHG
jgi:ribosomal protein S18 acetylase RimI-like enzyme